MKITVCGNYGAKNLGDELILEGLLLTLHKTYPRSEITVLSANPEETKKKYQIQAVEKFPAGFRSFIKYIFDGEETKKAFKNCDLFILGGGGLFGNLTFRANLIWGLQALMAYCYHKPVQMLGQSIGPLKNSFTKKIVKYLFKKAKKITVRDQKSQTRLKEIGINNVIIEEDFALKIPEKKSSNTQEKKIIIALRNMPNLTHKFKYEVAKFLDWLSEKGYQLQFIDFQLPEDTKLHEEIIELMRTKTKINHLSDIKNSPELFEKYSQASMVLGMRLHSIIVASKTHTPFIAINYADKVEDFLATIKIENSIKVQDVTLENLQKHFNL